MYSDFLVDRPGYISSFNDGDNKDDDDDNENRHNNKTDTITKQAQ
jgi:hypothetical protein